MGKSVLIRYQSSSSWILDFSVSITMSRKLLWFTNYPVQGILLCQPDIRSPSLELTSVHNSTICAWGPDRPQRVLESCARDGSLAPQERLWPSLEKAHAGRIQALVLILHRDYPGCVLRAKTHLATSPASVTGSLTVPS